MRKRTSGWCGSAFSALLLVSAAMADVPGGGDPVPVVRRFYVDHAGVVAIAQVIGLLAAAAFVPFVLGLGAAGRPRRAVVVTGLGVTAVAALTAVPALVGSALLGVLAPVALLVLVLALSVELLKGRAMVPAPAGHRSSRSARAGVSGE